MVGFNNYNNFDNRRNLFIRPEEKRKAPAVPAANNQSTNNPIAEDISQESVVNIENFSFSRRS